MIHIFSLLCQHSLLPLEPSRQTWSLLPMLRTSHLHNYHKYPLYQKSHIESFRLLPFFSWEHQFLYTSQTSPVTGKFLYTPFFKGYVATTCEMFWVTIYSLILPIRNLNGPQPIDIVISYHCIVLSGTRHA